MGLKPSDLENDKIKTLAVEKCLKKLEMPSFEKVRLMQIGEFSFDTTGLPCRKENGPHLSSS